MTWADLAKRTRADEGDLVRLLSRTGEALMQIAHLKGENSKAASLARETSELLLREPVR
jgi:superfamily II RNA helicase